MNFIKKIFLGKGDESVHRQFVRFGKGEYRNRALLSLWKTKNIKIKSSFEFANDLVKLCSGLGNLNVSGIILTKEDISGMMSMNRIKGDAEKKRGGLYYQNNIIDQELNGEQMRKLEESSYFALLNMEAPGIKLKIKPKLPKPGKGEDKIDDKFCQLEIDEKYYMTAKEDLFWDLPDCKKAAIAHTFVIRDIILPKGEKDYAKIRELAKRKGKIIRIANIDGKEVKKEAEFEA